MPPFFISHVIQLAARLPELTVLSGWLKHVQPHINVQSVVDSGGLRTVTITCTHTPGKFKVIQFQAGSRQSGGSDQNADLTTAAYFYIGEQEHGDHSRVGLQLGQQQGGSASSTLARFISSMHSLPLPHVQALWAASRPFPRPASP